MSDIRANPYLNSLLIESAQNPNQVQVPFETDEEKNTLGQSAFLELMITQMENQNPLEPQDNSEFVAQLAQFSSVEGIDRLNNSFDSFSSSFLSNQALQASSLVGTSVAVPASESRLFIDSYVGGSIDINTPTTNMTMNIYSDSGQLIEQIPMGPQAKGELPFRWDGYRLEVDGKLIDWESTEPPGPGTYRFEVLAKQGNENVQLDTALTANVNSVSFDANNQMILNLAGIGPVNINAVKQFN